MSRGGANVARRQQCRGDKRRSAGDLDVLHGLHPLVSAVRAVALSWLLEMSEGRREGRWSCLSSVDRLARALAMARSEPLA